MRYEETSSGEEPKDSDPRALSAFRGELERSGKFVDDAKYGTVWVPDRALVGEDFSPYVTNGRWALDSNGDWSWQSDFTFGRIVFHYGRWVWIDDVGWAWVPGYRYAPAWVDFRVPDEQPDEASADQVSYVGWAPTPPAYVWFYGSAYYYPYPYWYGPAPYWVFCPSPYVFAPGVGAFVVHDPHGAHHAAHHTHPYGPGVHGSGYAHGHHGHVHGPPPGVAKVPPWRVPTQRVRAPEHIARQGRPAAVREVGGSAGAERGTVDRAARATPRARGVSSSRAGESRTIAGTRYGESRTIAGARYGESRTIAGPRRGTLAPVIPGDSRRGESRAVTSGTRPATRVIPARSVSIAERGAGPVRVAPGSVTRYGASVVRAPQGQAPYLRGPSFTSRAGAAAPMRTAPMRSGAMAPMRSSVPMRSGAMGGVHSGVMMRGGGMHVGGGMRSGGGAMGGMRGGGMHIGGGMRGGGGAMHGGGGMRGGGGMHGGGGMRGGGGGMHGGGGRGR